MYRWKYHWPSSVSVGLVSATTRAARGFRCSMNRLIVPPLPAASRPSNKITCLLPVSCAQYWNFNSSICSWYFCSS